jgi:hypothetical protein
MAPALQEESGVRPAVGCHVTGPLVHGPLAPMCLQHRTRDLLVRQRTQFIDAMRAYLAEVGLELLGVATVVARHRTSLLVARNTEARSG